MRVLDERNLRRQDRLDAPGRLVAGVRVGRAGGVLEADRVKVNVALEQFAHDVDVEFWCVRLVRLERQPHHRDANLMVHAGIDDRLAGLDQVVDVVHEVKIAVDGRAVFVHQLGLQCECGGALGGQRDAGDRSGENLQIRLGTDDPSNLRHAVERIFANIKERRLEPCAAAKFKVPNAGCRGGLDGGQDVVEARLPAEHALESVAERGKHHPNLFF